jgi:hypothetical protein
MSDGLDLDGSIISKAVEFTAEIQGEVNRILEENPNIGHVHAYSKEDGSIDYWGIDIVDCGL